MKKLAFFSILTDEKIAHRKTKKEWTLAIADDQLLFQVQITQSWVAPFCIKLFKISTPNFLLTEIFGHCFFLFDKLNLKTLKIPV